MSELDPFQKEKMRKMGFPSLLSVIEQLQNMEVDVMKQYEIIPDKPLSKDQIQHILKDAEKFGAPPLKPKTFEDVFAITQYDDVKPERESYLIEKWTKIRDLKKKIEEEEAKERWKNDMWWHPKGKPKILASTMETPHLFFALRLLYNQVIDPEYRIDAEEKEFKLLTITELKEIMDKIRILFHIINQRDDIALRHLDKLRIMADNVRKYL